MLVACCLLLGLGPLKGVGFYVAQTFEYISKNIALNCVRSAFRTWEIVCCSIFTRFILEEITDLFTFYRIELLIGKYRGFSCLGMWETNALKAGITRKMLYLYGNLSNHCGHPRAVLQGLWESNITFVRICQQEA